MSKPLDVDIIQKHVIVSRKPLHILGRNSFFVEKGEFVSILGPSGCGKSTILRLILGLDLDYDGVIKLGNEVVTSPKLERGIVFQEARLLPWKSVKANIEFAIPENRRSNKSHVHVQQLIELVGLSGFEYAWPNQLSGGMVQRVALARALVNLPDLLLLDEPFGALDSHTRIIMQEEILRIFAREGTTTLMVTHDVEEAVFLSDKIIVMTHRPGSVSKIFTVETEKPRQRTSKPFVELRTKILEEVYGSDSIRISHKPLGVDQVY